MTAKQRLEAILRKQPVDRRAWTTLLDSTTLSAMPPAYRNMSPLDFYREIGCDIMQFGNYGLPPDVRMTYPAKLVCPGTETRHRQLPDGTQVSELHTPWGTLLSASRGGHPVRHPVASEDDLRVYTSYWTGAHYEEIPGTEESHQRLLEAIGDDGVYLPTVDASPVQRLLQVDMGVVSFYYLLHDHPEQFEQLLDAMHRCWLQLCEIVARRVPAIGVIPVENTSTTMISPALYRKYSVPQIRDFVQLMHRHGKLAVVHMCGLLKGLLPLFPETGMDAINALTAAPFGDTSPEDVLDTYGEDFVIFGTGFRPELFQAPQVSRDEIWRALDEYYTPRRRRANLLTGLGADGQPTPLERFLAVRDWMARNGAL